MHTPIASLLAMSHRAPAPSLALASSAEEASQSLGTPRDCVQEYPTLNPGSIQLVAFDWEGRARYRHELPLDDDIESWAKLMLTRCRKLFPAPARLTLLG